MNHFVRVKQTQAHREDAAGLKVPIVDPRSGALGFAYTDRLQLQKRFCVISMNVTLDFLRTHSQLLCVNDAVQNFTFNSINFGGEG